MSRKLIVALTLLLSATSATLAASHHYYGARHGYRHYAPRYGHDTWVAPNDTRRSFDYQQDMGAGSGKPGY